MKYTTKLISLMLVLALYSQTTLSRRAHKKPSKETTKACPCSQPRPPKPTTKTIKTDEDVTKACPCSQPKPPRPTNKSLKKDEDVTKACPCSQPRPPKPTTKPVETDEKACSCSHPKPPRPNTKVYTEVAVGELVDKITILTIKSENIKDPAKLENINNELETLLLTLEDNVEKSPELAALTADLLTINKQLWDIEDDIRDKERDKEFDDEFIQLARSVYYTNDERCATKRKINEVTGSRLLEEKSYADYK